MFVDQNSVLHYLSQCFLTHSGLFQNALPLSRVASILRTSFLGFAVVSFVHKPEVHPASYPMGTRDFFPGAKVARA